MTSPEEERRKNSADEKARQAEKPSESNSTPAPHNDALGFVGQLIGDARNHAADAVFGTHSGDKVLASINPQLAAQYQQGKQIQQRIDRGEMKGPLSATDQHNLDAFNSVKKSIAQLPMYDRESLMRYVEKGIEQKAKAAPPEVAKSSQTSKPVQTTELDKKASTDTSKQPHNSNPDVSKSAASKPVSTQPIVEKLESAKPAIAKPEGPKHDVSKSEPTKPDGTRTESARIDSAKFDTSKPIPEKAEPSKIESARADGAKSEPLKPSATREIVSSAPSNFARASDVSDVNRAQIAATSNVSKVENSKPGEVRHEVSLSNSQVLKQPKDEVLKPNVSGADSSKPESSTVKPSKFESSKPDSKSESPRSESSKSMFTSSMNAQNTFERRTAFDTKSNHVSDSLLSTKSTLDSSSRVAKTTPNDPNSFQSMRRVLEERTSIINKSSVEARRTERLPTQQSTPESVVKPSSSSVSSQSSSRIPLSEVKSNLSPHQIDSVSQIAGERFPSGLRWQNTLKPSESRSNPINQPTGRVDAAGVTGFSNLPGAKGVESFSIRGRVEDRYITGAEIALAAIVAAAGAKRVRFDEMNPGGKDFSSNVPMVQKIEAFIPNQSKPDSRQSEKTQMAQKDQISEKSQPQTFKVNRSVIAKAQEVVSQTKFENSQPKQVVVEPGNSSTNSVTRSETVKDIKPSEKRFITGAEIALAAIIATSGTARIRQHFVDRVGVANQTDDGKSVEKGIDDNGKISEDEKLSARISVQEGAHHLQKLDFKRTTMLIAPNDTLVSIAEAFAPFFDRNLAWLIADLNRRQLKETFANGKRIVEIHSRTAIELPTNEDRVAFFATWKDEFRPENLITIVLETQVDRELLDEHLGLFVEGATVPKPTPSKKLGDELAT